MININGTDPQQLSRQLCNTGSLACSWYHGSWHLLKSLGIVSTSAVHEAGISRLLKLAMAGMTAPRILMTGSTDETLMRLAHETCLELGIKAQLYAVDICATPLAFMQAYAKENNIELTTYHSDILEFETDGSNTENKFDIILTHAFMGYFDDTQRPLLVKKWRQLLSDRGKIVTIQRVRPADSPSLVTFTAQQSTQFLNAAIEAAKASALSDAELDSLKTAASEFTKNFISHAITSKTALESTFSDAGMNFQYLKYHKLRKKGELSGPSVPSDAEFAHIIAEKNQG